MFHIALDPDFMPKDLKVSLLDEKKIAAQLTSTRKDSLNTALSISVDCGADGDCQPENRGCGFHAGYYPGKQVEEQGRGTPCGHDKPGEGTSLRSNREAHGRMSIPFPALPRSADQTPCVNQPRGAGR